MSRSPASAFHVWMDRRNVILKMPGRGFYFSLNLKKTQWNKFARTFKTALGNTGRRPAGFSFSANQPMIGAYSVKGYRKLHETVFRDEALRDMTDREVKRMIPREFILEYNGICMFLSREAVSGLREACFGMKMSHGHERFGGAS